jgi:hypothetical protein
MSFCFVSYRLWEGKKKKNGDAGGTTTSKMPVVVMTRFGAV